MITASRTTASLSDAKNSKIELRCQAGRWDEFEIAMPRSTHSASWLCASRWNALSSTRWQISAPMAPNFSSLWRRANILRLWRFLSHRSEPDWHVRKKSIHRAALTVVIRLSKIADAQGDFRET